MRDKVKRFISILMTALMLVNLLPVGALADGITSIGYKPEVAASTGYYTVYVYARFDGDPLPGVVLNNSQWYTIGKIEGVHLPSPGGRPWWGGRYTYYNNNEYCGSTVSFTENGQQISTSASGIIGGLKQEHNTSIVIKSDEWISANFKACPGADTYMEGTSEPAWHLDIIVDINKNPPVHNLVFKVNNTNGKKIGTTQKITGKWTNPLSSNTYWKGNPVPETIIDDGRIYRLKERWEGNPNLNTEIYFNEPIKNVEFYYKDMGPVNRNYTVNHYWMGDQNTPIKTETNEAALGSIVTATPDTIDGYTITPESNEVKWITITEGTNEINFYYYKNVELTANSDTATYDGTLKSVSGFTGAPEGVTFDGITEPSASGTDVGTYWAEFAEGTVGKVDTTEKYIVTAANDGQLVIEKRKVTLTSASDSKPYDGTPLTNDKVTAEGFVEGQGAVYEVTGSQTNVGTSDNTFTYTLNEGTNPDNYDITKTEGKLTVTKNETEVVVKITGHKDTQTYDGNSHTVTGYEVTIPEGSAYTENDITFSGNAEVKGTDAKTYPMGLTADQFKNKNGNFTNVTFKVVEDGQLVINPRSVTLTSEGGSKPYDGQPLTKPDVTVDGDGFVAGEVTNIRATGTITDVGTVTNTIDYEKSANFKESNYAIAKEEGKLSITPVTDKVTVTITENSDTVKYDGTEHKVTGYDVDISNSLYTEKDFTFSGNAEAKGTDAGSYDMELKPSDFQNTNTNFANVKFVIVDGALTINKRSVKLTSASDEKVYDGKPLMNETVAVGGDGFATGEGATYKVTGSQTVVGSSENTFTYTLNDGTKLTNYNIELALGKLEVTPVTEEVIVTITGRTDEMPYDGKEHSVFGYDVTPSNALYNPKEDMQFNGTDVDMTAKGTDAGTYPMELTAEDFTNKSNNFTNVTFVVTDGYVKITPRAVTLTSETAGKTYDGTALTKPVVTVGGDGFVEGQVKEIKATGSVTNAGSVANTITFTPDKETFKEGNYAITKNEGTLTIAKRSVLLTSQSATKTYDGSALTRPAVTITGDGFVPGELAKVEATGSITNVGSTPNAIQYTTTGAFNPANYSIALSVGTLTVTAKPEPEPRRTFNLTVNYVYQNGKRAAASYNRGGLKNGETFDITSPVIAGYTASETVVSGTIDNRDIKVTVIYTADGVNLDDYGVPLGLGNITMNVGDCFE